MRVVCFHFPLFHYSLVIVYPSTQRQKAPLPSPFPPCVSFLSPLIRPQNPSNTRFLAFSVNKLIQTLSVRILSHQRSLQIMMEILQRTRRRRNARRAQHILKLFLLLAIVLHLRGFEVCRVVRCWRCYTRWSIRVPKINEIILGSLV